jgi:quaternary ammonium compound-resistance protein SugE
VAWIVLMVSGVLESVWATALGRSEGMTRPLPTALFAIALALSMAGLAFALRTLPTGTAYAVWVGIGAALTVIIGMVAGQESVNPARIALLLTLIGSIVGLKLLG